jgi:hypothetical protein
MFQFAGVCAATFGFFNYFRIDGLDKLSLALRDNQTINRGFADGFFSSPSNGASTNAGFPSTSDWFGSNDANPNTAFNNNVPSQLPSFRDPQSLMNSSDRWAGNQVQPNDARVQSANFSSGQPQRNLVHHSRHLRLGAINAEHLTTMKLKDPFISDRMGQLISDFHCIALQSVDTSNPSTVADLIKLAASNGKSFESIDGASSRSNPHEGLVILFDSDMLEADRLQSYTLKDQSGLLEYEPLVAWFRSKTATPDDALTFTFVNAQLSKSNNRDETAMIRDIIASIAADGRHEDDIIVAGTIQHSADTIAMLRQHRFQIFPQELPQNSPPSGNCAIILNAGCREFAGSSGYYNILRRYNLTPQEASAITSFAPAWIDMQSEESDVY